MFSHPTTYYNSEYDLYKLIKKEDIKYCVLCLENETESNMEFFNYNNIENDILIKQCECCPTIHKDCLILFLHKSDQQICIICKKQLLYRQKNMLLLMNYNLIIYKIKNNIIFIKQVTYYAIRFLYNIIVIANIFIFISFIFMQYNSILFY